jgi:hypothetical protein
MTTATRGDDLEAVAVERQQYAAKIRKWMKTPAIWECHEERPYLDALILLSHLDPAWSPLCSPTALGGEGPR